MPNIDSAQGPSPTKGPIVTNSAKVNLLSTNKPPKGKSRILRRIFFVLLLAIVVLGGTLVLRAVNLSDKIFVGRKISFFQKIKEVFAGSTGQIRLSGEDEGQINVLLLGIGGEGHDGPYLTDTMIVAQIRPSDGEVVLTSIPRDYWVTIPGGFGQGKINSAFSDGYVKHHDWAEGGETSVKTVEKLTGLKIPYFAVIDFSGFEKAINQIGGIDVKVERTFTDYTFPNDATLGYLEPQTFTEGWQHMDGTKSLIFARSRHAAGPEGSDFARSLRQQKVISAFKDKVLNLNLISDSGKINNLLGTFADHFHTNISPGEIFRTYSLVKQNNISNILSLSLDPETSLICSKILEDTGAYVLTPCEGKTDADIQAFFKNAFSIGKLSKEKAIVWMASSNHNTAAYDRASRLLTQAGLTVWEFSYAGKELPQNLFYEVNAKPSTAEFLKNTLNATEATLPPPNLKLDPEKLDIVIILGGNSAAIKEQP